MPYKIVDDPFAPCSSREHDPPIGVEIPEGKMLVHTCPKCGKETKVRPYVKFPRTPDDGCGPIKWPDYPLPKYIKYRTIEDYLPDSFMVSWF